MTPAGRYENIPATVLRITAGDTAVLDLDLGYNLHLQRAFRLDGISTRAMTDPGGPEARTALATVLGRGALTVKSVKNDVLADPYTVVVTVTEERAAGVPTNYDVHAWLVEMGWALPWDGKGTKPLPAWPRKPAAAAQD